MYNAAAVAPLAAPEDKLAESLDERAVSPYPPSKSVTSVYSNLEFSLLDRPEFRAELDRRRMATTPSPGLPPIAGSAINDDGSDLSSPARDDQDDTEIADDTLTPSMVKAKSETADEAVAAEISRPNRRRASQRSPTRATLFTSTSKRIPGRRARHEAKDAADDADAISETASTLSALSDNGEEDPAKSDEEETVPSSKRRGRQTSKKKAEKLPTPPEAPDQDEEEEGEAGVEEGDEEEVEGEAGDENDEQEDDGEEEEEEESPDEIGPGDMPFKSPGKKEAKRRKSTTAAGTSGGEEQSDTVSKRGARGSGRGRGGRGSRGRGRGASRR